jgi:predicted GNAT family N-acyltransferase
MSIILGYDDPVAAREEGVRPLFSTRAKGQVKGAKCSRAQRVFSWRGTQMSSQLSVLLLVAIEDRQVRDRMLRHLQAGGTSKEPEQVNRVAPLGEATDQLQKWYAQPGSSGAVLLSDHLVDEGLREPTNAAKGLFDDFGEKLYATIAVMQRPERILDIDRTVAIDCGPEELLGALKLCLDRLAYLQPPQPRKCTNPVVVRRVETETELFNYFMLRHAVYTPMSYLEALVEQAPSHMEIDWFDTRSVHIGAFEKTPTYERLIGTARLIATEPLDEHHSQMTRELARRDPVLDRLVREGAVPALLPVFQSQQRLVGHLQKAWEAEVRVVLGELSRVVVHGDYRGAGVSLALSKHAIALAEEAGLFELFLECLPIHEKIYEKVGFKTMPLHGKVFSVNKTMVVMHQPLLRAPIVSGHKSHAASPEHGTGPKAKSAPIPSRSSNGSRGSRRAPPRA